MAVAAVAVSDVSNHHPHLLPVASAAIQPSYCYASSRSSPDAAIGHCLAVAESGRAHSALAPLVADLAVDALAVPGSHRTPAAPCESRPRARGAACRGARTSALRRPELAVGALEASPAKDALVIGHSVLRA